ncbi:MAG: hemolysin family protein [Muribaculaceae bacterium]
MTVLTVTLVSMVFSAFFSGMEIAFISSNKVRVGIDTQKGGITSRIIDTFYNHSDMFISTMLVGNNIMLVVYGMGMAKLCEPGLTSLLGGSEVLVLIAQTLISTGIILITGEFFPKTIFRVNPNDSLRTFATPLYLIYLLLYPISLVTSALSSLLMRIFGVKLEHTRVKAITMGELDAYLQENIDTTEEENKEVEREVKIFQNAIDFSSTHLRDCMVPRNEMVAVNIDTTGREELSRRFTQSGLSKIVVYRDDIDNVLGYIHVSELFTPQNNWKECIKPVIFAPETMLANKMMQSLLKEKRSMAVVIDEFGGTAGIVTLEDLVEEIFGEIEDEHDHNRLIARQTSEGVYEFSGRMEIEEINEKFHLDLPESDEYQTIAGYILFNLEEIPAQGESMVLDGMKLTVLKKSAARLELVQVDTNAVEESEK